MLQLNDPPSFMRTMFQRARAMGASAIRLDVAPALVFGDPSGTPDFFGLDAVTALAREYHLRVIGDLFTIPSWIADCQMPTDPSAMARSGTDDLTRYRSLISQIVARADPAIRDWEIWNEPDTAEFFTGTPAQYAAMLRTAHDAIKAIDPAAEVLLGGISGPSGMAWLGQVFASPGADAAHAFDIANVHERADLYGLAPDIAGWKHFLAGYRFTGPLWVTEHGYPADPAYQYDPAYNSGPDSQAAYLTASIPTLIDAGASEVFVTERDNLSGQFASEGVLGGDVSDLDATDPDVVPKQAYAVVGTLAACYSELGRDCPGPPPTVSPSSVSLRETRPGRSSTAVITVSNPGSGPVALGAATLASAGAAPLSIQSDGCSGQILEPAETCRLSVRFAPAAGGGFATAVDLPSDNGTVGVAVTAVAPSVSSLTGPPLTGPLFLPTRASVGVGHVQRVTLTLTNPLAAVVGITRSALSGPGARRFAIRADRCTGTELGPGAGCRLSVVFTPVRAGVAGALLTLRGTGTPLRIELRAAALSLGLAAASATQRRRGRARPPRDPAPRRQAGAAAERRAQALGRRRADGRAGRGDGGGLAERRIAP